MWGGSGKAGTFGKLELSGLVFNELGESVATNRYTSSTNQINGGRDKNRAIGPHSSCSRTKNIALPLSMQEITMKIRFDDQLYFSRLFHRHLRMAPTAYRREFSLPH